MSNHLRRPTPNKPLLPLVALHERAIDNVAFVRDIVERSAHFTAVPGWGGIAMGITALLTASLFTSTLRNDAWLRAWLVEGVLAAVIALATSALKARRSGISLAAGPARRFALCLLPALVAGGTLTFAIAHAGAFEVLPPMWLLLYGTGVCAAGAVSSPPVVSLLGIALIVGGVLAALSPAAWGNWYPRCIFWSRPCDCRCSHRSQSRWMNFPAA